MTKKQPNLFIKILYLIICISIVYFAFIPVANILFSGIFFEDTIEEYVPLFKEILGYLKNSLIISIPVTIIATTFGIVSSITLWRVRFFGRKIMRLLVLFPLINPPFVGSVAFIMLFGRRGVITNTILGLSTSPFGAHGVIAMQIVGLSTLAYLIISSSVKKINTNYENASRNLGASEARTFFSVTLPIIKPEIIVAAMLVFLASMADFGTPLIIGGDFKTLASNLYIQVTGHYDMNAAAFSGLILLIPCFIAFFIQKYFSEKNTYQFQWHEGEDINYNRVPLWTKAGLVGYTSIYILLVFMIYGFMTLGAFTEAWGYDYSFTLRHIQDVFETNLTPFINSVKLALWTSIVSSFLGVLLAYLLKFRKLRFSNQIDFMATLPAGVPGILFGLGYLVTFKYPLFGVGEWVLEGMDPITLLGTGIIIYIICIYRYLYMGLKSGYAYIENMNSDVELASNNLGAGDIRTFFQIILPILKPAFNTAFIRNFATTMTTLGAIIFLLLPQNRVAVQQIFQILTSSTIGAGAAMGIMLTFLSLTLLITFQLIINYKIVIKKVRSVLKLK